MLNAKKNMRRYLDLIAPWMSGDWNEETLADPEFQKRMGDPSHSVFMIPTRDLPNWFEALLLGDQNTANLMWVLSWVTRINTAIERYNITNIGEERLPAAIALHKAIAVFKPHFLLVREDV